jgi:hypothetical protein
LADDLFQELGCLLDICDEGDRLAGGGLLATTERSLDVAGDGEGLCDGCLGQVGELA